VIALTVSGQLLLAVSGQIPMTVNNHAEWSGATADPHAKPPFGMPGMTLVRLIETIHNGRFRGIAPALLGCGAGA
jgi:hypothetical protein